MWESLYNRDYNNDKSEIARVSWRDLYKSTFMLINPKCCICNKISTNQNQPIGQLTYIQVTNSVNVIEKLNKRKNNISQIDNTELSGDVQFYSCGHYAHINCFNQTYGLLMEGTPENQLLCPTVI